MTAELITVQVKLAGGDSFEPVEIFAERYGAWAAHPEVNRHALPQENGIAVFMDPFVWTVSHVALGASIDRLFQSEGVQRANRTRALMSTLAERIAIALAAHPPIATLGGITPAIEAAVRATVRAVCGDPRTLPALDGDFGGAP